MDFKSLKKASDLLDAKWKPQKSDVELLMQDTTEKSVLRKFFNAKDTELCTQILSEGFFPKLYNLEILIPKDLVKAEIVNLLKSEKIGISSFCLNNGKFSVKLAFEGMFGRVVQVEAWLKFVELRLDSSNRYLIVDYGFDSKFFSFVRKVLPENEHIKVLSQNKGAGRLKVDLERYSTFLAQKGYIKKLNCSTLDLISFSSIRHSSKGVVFVCDQNWEEIANKIKMRLAANLTKKMHKPSVWMIHRN